MLKTGRVLEPHFIPTHAVYEVEKLMNAVGICLAPKTVSKVLMANSSSNTQREVPETILVVGLGQEESRSTESALDNHHVPKPQTGVFMNAELR